MDCIERRGSRRHAVRALLLACLLCSAAEAGTPFGIFDARTLAMGGTAAASANTDNAQFYNPALLAFNEEIEERTRDSRFLLPILAPQLSKSAFDAEEIVSDDLGEDLSRAIDAFNAAPNAGTAGDAAAAAGSLRRAAARLDDEDLFGDIYVGMALSEPGKFQGAGFFLGARFIAGGRTDVRAEDLDALAAYEEGLEFVASGGTAGAARPELFDAGGSLIDPVDGLESSAAAAGVSITEVGVAIGENFDVRGKPLAAGATFKMLDIDTFEDVERLVEDRIDVDRNEESVVRFNLDLGLAREFGERWRVGLAVKDAIPYNVETSLGNKIRLRPRPRAGLAYTADKLQVALDVDLINNEALANERATQEAAVGLEWSPLDGLRVRTGVRGDVRGVRDPVSSVGLGFVLKRLALDVAYAEGGDLRAAALQLGLVF